MKTVRFTRVVASCGQPVVHNQWVALAKDAALKKAVKEKRLMTVHIHTVGTTKDYGEAGLIDGDQRVFLVFPKSLRACEGKRVVGIDYGLLKEEPPPAKKRAAKKAHAEPKPPAKPKTSPEMLRLFRPVEEGKAKPKPEPEPEPEPKKARATDEEGRLRTQIQKALKQLKSGKAVMAYETLEKALR